MYNIRGSQIGNLSQIYLDHIGFKTNGYFIEVGGYDGIQWSNTYSLAKIGWNGLIFEPQSYIFEKCVENYKDYPNIKMEKCCIGSYNGDTDLYVAGPLTTTSKKMVDEYKTLDWAKGLFMGDVYPIKSPIYTLDNMLEKYNCPFNFDVLVIDTEGTELDVLKGFSIDKWKPKMMIIELHEINVIEVSKLMERHDYKKIHEDKINTVFVLN